MSKSYLTAIARKKLSAPVRWLLENGYIEQGYLLDYGCGKGDDVRLLNESLYYPGGAYGWDPYHKTPGWFCPDFAEYEWETVLCTYVLNVLPEDEREAVIQDLLSLDAKRVYVTVRRDLKQDYKLTKRGTEQWMVRLNFPVVVENSNFCIYDLTLTK